MASCGARNISSIGNGSGGGVESSGIDDICDDDGKFDAYTFTQFRGNKFDELIVGDGDDGTGSARKILDGVLSRITSMFG